MQNEIRLFESLTPQADINLPPADRVASSADQPSGSPGAGLMPQDCACNQEASSTASSAPTYIYAIGNLRALFPSLSVEAVFNQSVAASGSSSPDYTLQSEVFSSGGNIYIARDMCWVLEVNCADTYLVKPRTYLELYAMVSAIQPTQKEASRRYVVIIGPRGPMAPPEMCPGLQLPVAVCNQLYSFTFDEFVTAISAKTGVLFEDAASMFYEMLRIGDNAGETYEHRAINCVALRYPSIYLMAANMLGHPPVGPYSITGQVYTLVGVTAKRAPVQGARVIVDIVFQYKERRTGGFVNWYCQVDVTGQFPFLVRPLSRYYPYL